MRFVNAPDLGTTVLVDSSSTGGGRLRQEPTRLDLNVALTPSRKLYLVGLYSVAWLWILLAADSVFWDDWTLIVSDQERIQRGFDELGVPLYGYMHEVLLSLGPWSYRVLTLVAWLMIGFLWEALLRRFPGMTPNLRWIATAVFLLAPIYSARFLLVVMNYTLSLLFFTLAWYLFIRSLRLSPIRAVTASLCLLISYTSNQLLPFTLVIVASAVCIRSRFGPSTGNWRPLAIVLLPILYFPISRALFPRQGIWESAYQFDLLSAWPLVVATAFGVFLSCWMIVRFSASSGALRGWLVALVSGITLMLLAIFPYWVSGRSVTTNSWFTRNQLLLGFGISILVVALTLLLSSLMGKRVSSIFVTMLLVTFILIDISVCRAYVRDWRKQEQIIALLSQTPEIQAVDFVFFDDQTLGSNLYSRGYTWFEWNALLLTAFGEETRFGVSESFHLQQYLDGQLDLQFSEDATTNGAIEHARSTDGLLVRVVSEPLGAAWNFPTYRLEPQGTLPLESLPLDRPYSGRDN